MKYKSFTALLLICSLLIITSGFDACGKKSGGPPPEFNLAETIRNAKVVGAALRGTGPIVQSLIPDVIKEEVGRPIVAVINTGSIATTELIGFLEAGDLSNALQVGARLTSIVGRLISQDALLLPAGRSRTLFLAALMSADIALAIIFGSIPAPAVASFAQSADQSAGQAVEVLRAFAKQPRLRARDLTTGRFVSIEYASANPDTTTIERVKTKE